MALGIPMAMLYGGLAAGGGSLLGGLLGKGEAPQQGYDVVTMPQYDWAQGNQMAASDYYNQGTQYLQQGQLPPGFQDFYNTMQTGMQEDSADRFYGTAGRAGSLRDIIGLGSITGVGPRATLSKGLQAEYDYMTEGRKIDEYIASLKANEFSRQSQMMPAGLAGLARGPESQIVNMMGGVGGTAGVGADMASAFGGLGSAFANYAMSNQNQPSTTTLPGRTLTDYNTMGIGANFGQQNPLGGLSNQLTNPYSPGQYQKLQAPQFAF